MIVDPDFFDHWRTRIVYDLLGEDDLTPIYIMRIWAHCQSRKATRFDGMSPLGLKALCRFKGDAVALESALIEAGFIVRDGTAIDVPKWAQHNAKLIANWQNGLTGGRPKQTQEEPNHNPTETKDEPTGTHAEPIREDEIRLDKKTSPPKTEARGSRLPSDWHPPSEYVEFCKTERPDLDPALMAKKFLDYWADVPGQKGRKVDWIGTWRNFIRSERAPPNARGSLTKFDPVAHVNRTKDPPNERTITFDESGEPV